MEALYPGCTTKLGKQTQPPSVTGKILDRRHHTMYNIYSSTSETNSVSPVLPQQNSMFDPTSTYNGRCATMPSHLRKTPQHPQTHSVYSQQKTSPVYPQQLPNTSRHATMTSYGNMITSQYSQASSVHPQQLSSTSQLQCTRTSSLPSSFNRWSYQDHISSGKSLLFNY